jgi:two-component system chemotaxis response regulator CheB
MQILILNYNMDKSQLDEQDKNEDSDDSMNPRFAFHVPRSGLATFRAIVIGGSAGGFEALNFILHALPAHFNLPILTVQHLHPADNGLFAQHLGRNSHLAVMTPCDKEKIRQGCVYVAPANYHMLVERSGSIALSIDEKVSWSRPSIDVLFESAAYAWGNAVIAIILSGANDDGTKGMGVIKRAGGLTIAQEPADAEFPLMPQAAINAGVVDEILPLAQIGNRLIELGMRNGEIRENNK